MKKPNFENYNKWLYDNHRISINESTKNLYSTTVESMKTSFEASDFWEYLEGNIATFQQQYLVKTGYQLFAPYFKLETNSKPYNSFLLKTYRKNILNNKNWPNEPNCKWVFPDNWFSKTNDIIRFLFVAKYLDGTEFIKDVIYKYCQEKDIKPEIHYEVREEGYYSVHIYIPFEFEAPCLDWSTVIITTKIEIQIITQLQEVIRELLHKEYCKKRSKPKKSLKTWQWDYNSAAFSSNYLGHMLQYLEGNIIKIRNNEEERTQDE